MCIKLKGNQGKSQREVEESQGEYVDAAKAHHIKVFPSLSNNNTAHNWLNSPKATYFVMSIKG